MVGGCGGRQQLGSVVLVVGVGTVLDVSLNTEKAFTRGCLRERFFGHRIRTLFSVVGVGTVGG